MVGPGPKKFQMNFLGGASRRRGFYKKHHTKIPLQPPAVANRRGRTDEVGGEGCMQLVIPHPGPAKLQNFVGDAWGGGPTKLVEGVL